MNTQDMDMMIGQIGSMEVREIGMHKCKRRRRKEGRKEGKTLYFEGNMMVHYSETRRKDNSTNICTFFSCLVGVKRMLHTSLSLS